MSEKKSSPNVLQPLTRTQIAKNEAYIARLEQVKTTRGELPVGTELTWEMCVSPEFAVLYADPVEDYNLWYEAWPMGPGESPFGTAIAPPMLLGHFAFWFWVVATGGLGGGRGGVATSWDSYIVAPIQLGTTVRCRGKLADKFVKRGRQYVRMEMTVEDAETGKLLFRHAYESLSRYAKAE